MEHCLPSCLCQLCKLLRDFFIVLGIFPFLRKEKNNDVYPTKRRSNIPLISSFLLVALMELGDKTQILTITLAAQSSLITVLLGMFFAFMLLTGVAVFLDTKLISRLPVNLLKTGTSVLFIILGSISIISGLFQFSIF
ncbi:MAG: TMEM165/GDT1 family protein [Chloroflexota bacterium]